MDDNDRRKAPRQKVSLAAEIETADGRLRSAISRDASETGLLLLTRIDLPSGHEVRLHVLRSDEGAPPIVVRGRVIRSEPLDEEEALLWRRKLAVALDDPPAELFEEMRVFAEKQRALYGP